MREQAEAKAQEIAEGFKKEYEEQVKRLKEISANRMETAVDMIVERIVKAHGNS